MIHVYRRIRRAFDDTIADLVVARESAKDMSRPLEDLVDEIYLLKKSEQLIRELRKEAQATFELIERVTCARLIASGSIENIKGDICTGIPKTRVSAKIPKRHDDPEAYDRLMEFLGMPTDMLEESRDVIRIHWPGFTNYLTTLAQEGKPLPPGIDPESTNTTYFVECRPARGLDLDALASGESNNE